MFLAINTVSAKYINILWLIWLCRWWQDMDLYMHVNCYIRAQKNSYIQFALTHISVYIWYRFCVTDIIGNNYTTTVTQYEVSDLNTGIQKAAQWSTITSAETKSNLLCPCHLLLTISTYKITVITLQTSHMAFINCPSPHILFLKLTSRGTFP